MDMCFKKKNHNDILHDSRYGIVFVFHEIRKICKITVSLRIFYDKSLIF